MQTQLWWSLVNSSHICIIVYNLFILSYYRPIPSPSPSIIPSYWALIVSTVKYFAWLICLWFRLVNSAIFSYPSLILLYFSIEFYHFKDQIISYRYFNIWKIGKREKLFWNEDFEYRKYYTVCNFSGFYWTICRILENIIELV